MARRAVGTAMGMVQGAMRGAMTGWKRWREETATASEGHRPAMRDRKETAKY